MNEKDLQTIADLTADFFQLVTKPVVKFKNVSRGRANLNKGYFTIPLWSAKYGEDFLTYYTVHETCHFKYGPHGKSFKAGEIKALAQWGLKPVYAKAYPKRIYNTAGETVYESWREKRKVKSNNND